MLITKTVQIYPDHILENDDVIFRAEEPVDPNDFLKTAFRQLCPPYPKFFKMDKLSKLAFLGSEILLRDAILPTKYNKDETGLVFLNASSTIEIDKDHQNTINSRENYFPSPSVFVYTLPNIMLGEICIKNQIFGENAVYISEKFDTGLLYQQVKILFDTCRLKACITGWSEINGDNYEVFLMLVESDQAVDNSKEKCNFDPENIEKLYKR